MVNKRLMPGVRGQVELDQDALYILEVALQSIQESAGL